MSWLAITDGSLGACCADCPEGTTCVGMGQADPTGGIFSFLDTIVGAGVKFLPETKEMRQRREASEALERERLEASRIRAALTSKTAISVGALVLGGVVLWSLLGRRKR